MDDMAQMGTDIAAVSRGQAAELRLAVADDRKEARVLHAERAHRGDDLIPLRREGLDERPGPSGVLHGRDPHPEALGFALELEDLRLVRLDLGTEVLDLARQRLDRAPRWWSRVKAGERDRIEPRLARPRLASPLGPAGARSPANRSSVSRPNSPS